MSAAAILTQLQALGTSSYRRILKNHGAQEPLDGVKIADLKRILKVHRGDHDLALKLYATRNYDAQYLAGLMVDPGRMSRADLQRWLKSANSVTICGNIVATVAAESRHGEALAKAWIESPRPDVAQTGWVTLTALISIREDDALDLPWLQRLLQQVALSIHEQPDRVRYAMNGFVIAAGCFVAALTTVALATAKTIGAVEVDLGETACRVPDATEYIRKVQARGAIGKKRSSARC